MDQAIIWVRGNKKQLRIDKGSLSQIRELVLTRHTNLKPASLLLNLGVQWRKKCMHHTEILSTEYTKSKPCILFLLQELRIQRNTIVELRVYKWLVQPLIGFALSTWLLERANRRGVEIWPHRCLKGIT